MKSCVAYIAVVLAAFAAMQCGKTSDADRVVAVYAEAAEQIDALTAQVESADAAELEALQSQSDAIIEEMFSKVSSIASAAPPAEAEAMMEAAGEGLAVFNNAMDAFQQAVERAGTGSASPMRRSRIEPQIHEPYRDCGHPHCPPGDCTYSGGTGDDAGDDSGDDTGDSGESD